MDNKIIESILKRIDEQKDHLVETLLTLVSIPTENPPGENYETFLLLLSEQIKSWNLDHELIELPLQDGTGKAHYILGQYGVEGKALHFHGHYDVVPAAKPEQFKPYVKDDRIFGRGSADMKSGLLAMLLAIQTVKELGIPLNIRITFSVVPDEETGGKKGTEILFKTGYLPMMPCIGMIMAEPTGNTVWSASKGALTYRVKIKGKFAHVGLAHQGENTFEHMVAIGNDLLKLKESVDKKVTSMNVVPPEANRSVMLLGGQSGSGFNFNIVPEESYFTIDRRFNPEENKEEVKREIDDIIRKHREKGVRVEAEIFQEADAAFSSPEAPFAQTLNSMIESVTGITPSFILCPGLCETRFFSAKGIPAYAYGPGLLEVAHSPHENVAVESILNCAKVYALMILKVSEEEKKD